MALAQLLEKGSDADLLREMVGYARRLWTPLAALAVPALRSLIRRAEHEVGLPPQAPAKAH